MHYQLLAIDIDGTLVNSRDELSPTTREALVRAQEAGMHIVLATGRRYSQTLHLVEPLGIKVPLVTASGGLVKDPADHRTLFKAEFAPDVLRAMLATLGRLGCEVLLTADTYAEGFDFYLDSTEIRNPYLAEYATINATRGRVWPGLIAAPPLDVFGGFIMGTRDEMLRIEGQLHALLPGTLTTHVLQSPKYRGFMCELAPAGVTKWSAVRRLAHAWQIEDKAICAVGDDVNDIPMIRAAGLGVAMGNALPEVKAAADRIAPGHDDDGLAEVVRWVLEE